MVKYQTIVLLYSYDKEKISRLNSQLKFIDKLNDLCDQFISMAVLTEREISSI